MVDRKQPTQETLLKILDRARWAPSGDNTQPWRFQIVADEYLIVHGHDTRDEILYDFDGHASHIAHGALLETMRIAASVFGLRMNWESDADAECRHVKYHVRFEASPSIGIDPLQAFIESRCVQRRPMTLQALDSQQRAALIVAPGDAYEVQLFESFPQRRRIAKLLWDNAYIRLTCPEAYPVHASIIEWGAKYSKDKIPEQAVGVDPLTAKLMRWVMGSWARVRFFNHYLLGTVAPRVQLDYLPAIFCAAHVLIRAKNGMNSLKDWLALGAAVQRFWLEAARQGLHLQPEMTPLIFGWYAASGRTFSQTPEIGVRTKKLASDLVGLVNNERLPTFGFFCRVGVSKVPGSRSIRLGLEKLLLCDRSA